MTATTPARTGVSPSSSPRLPSPPPFTEVQFGPQSPTVGDANSDFQLGDSTKPDEGAARRIRPGTRAADMASGPPLVPLSQLDSPFQLQEHIKALYAVHTRSADGEHIVPITKETALVLAKPPELSEGEAVDKHLWLYELCRFLVMKANNMIVALFENGCTNQTCPEMRASEWQYLCAVHDPPKSCAAIDYCCHTLDWAANMLTSPKHFPSRLSLGGEGTNAAQSMRHLVNIFRRVYRIFAHAWFQHSEAFWSVEAKDGLYIFFKTVCDVYSLITEDNYTIPASAEGQREDLEETPIVTESEDQSRLRIFQRGEELPSQESAVPSITQDESSPTSAVGVGATARRHKHTPSTGTAVAMIAEGTEEEDDTVIHDQPGSQASEPLPAFPHIEMPTPYDFRAPEDPTPTAHDIDPFAAVRAESPGPAVEEEPSETSVKTAVKVEEVEEAEVEKVNEPEKEETTVGGEEIKDAVEDDEHIGEPIDVSATTVT